MGKLKNIKNRGSIKGFFILSAFIVIVFAGAFALAFNFVTNSKNDKDGEIVAISPEDGIEVEIPMGAGTDTIISILKEKEIIRSGLIYKVLSNIHGYDGGYKAGTHIVAKGLDYEDIMMILSSNPVSVKVRIKEGSTINQVVDELLKSKVISDKASFYKTAADGEFGYKFLEGLPERENRLEGYLIPDTYQFGLKAKDEEIIKVLLDNFNNKFKPEYYEKAKEMGLTVDQVVTLASIIEKEASNKKDRNMVAQVFYNRLNKKDGVLDKLQSCATIQYVFLTRMTDVTEADKTRIAQGIILDKDTASDDPYNTYKFSGLPPGPICSPSRESIEAALNPDPEAKDYYYFVAKGDGTHDFSRTYAEHEAKVKKYQSK